MELGAKRIRPEYAASIASIDVEKIYKAAEMLAKPVNGKRVKASIGIERASIGRYTGNTNLTIASLATVIGTGGRRSRDWPFWWASTRWISWWKIARNKSPEKVAGRRRRSIDTDRYLYSGHTRMAHVIGTTWIQSMCGSYGLKEKFIELTTRNPYQAIRRDKQHIIDTLKKSVQTLVAWWLSTKIFTCEIR